MRILMLGNSYIFTNNLPQMLAELTGAEVIHHTRGGARLAEQLNPNTAMGAQTLSALNDSHWDYVVLQEMSNGPVTSREKFLQSAAALCKKILSIGAVPVFYLTWPYQKDGPQLQKSGLDYEKMYSDLQSAYREAAATNHGLIADVGTAFYERRTTENLYAGDGSHPNEAGSLLAAKIIAHTIMEDFAKRE